MQNNFRICSEKPYPLGCYIDYDKSLVVRAVFGDCKKCGITLYPDNNDSKIKPLSIKLPESFKKGNIYSARIRDIDNIDSYVSYNYFKDNSYFCDPYAKHVIGLETFGADVPDSDIRAKLDNKSNRQMSEHQFDWGEDVSPKTPYSDSFIYLLHVRGFTKSSTSGVISGKRGTFNGILEKIPYIKKLGVTTLELMPVYEMNEVENPIISIVGKDKKNLVYSKNGSILNEKAIVKRLNYWGYKKGYYFAPRTAYCEDAHNPENEFKHFIKVMHENGLEVVLQFFFEENENESLIIDALRYWRCSYHVDGFHCKGARIPIRQIINEPLFSDVKIWYDWFENTKEHKYLATYNNNFLYSARRFLKSDDNTVNDFLHSMIGRSNTGAVINYIADYEGFRLSDLVSFEHKHNEENGENNKDGSDNNLSWNCGIEGRTRKHNILQLRKKQMMNILTMLFMAQGTPMLYSGDEFGFSQGGNNNPYCQDNDTSWLDWRLLEKNSDIFDYAGFLLDFRKKHGFLHGEKPFKLMDYISCGYPDLSFHGREAWRPDLSGYSHVLSMLYCGLYDKKSDDKPFIYVCYNMYWQKQDFALPKLPEGLKWQLVKATGDNTLTDEKALPDSKTLEERSVGIYISVPDEEYKKNRTKKTTNGKK